MATKIRGNWISLGNGIKISAGKPSTPKRKGTLPRIWISIRQDDPKTWRVYESLSYAKGVDILFVKEP